MTRSRGVSAWTTCGALLFSLVTSVALITHTSSAAFITQTSTPKNNWTSGYVDLEDDDKGVAMFSVNNIKPGDSGERCIVVTNSSKVTNDTKMYFSSPPRSGSQPDLGTSLRLVVDIGLQNDTNAGNGSCVGFNLGRALLDDTVNNARNINAYSNGIGRWTHQGLEPHKRTYRIRWSLPESAGNEISNGQTQINFVWSSRSI